MRKKFIIIMLCVANIGFAQVEMDNAGNTGMGAEPLSNAKLHLYNTTTSSPDVNFGLYSLMADTSNAPSISATQPMYGAYFKNTRKNQGDMGSPPQNELYGIYLENTLQSFGKSWGIYLKNERLSSGASQAESYGIQLINNDPVTGAAVYGIHLSNTKKNSSGKVFGVYSENVRSGSTGAEIYGIYSYVEGGNANNRYAGYFTGGKVAINGELWIDGQYYTGSDECLKKDIKSLSDEKEKLYLLQGKSYIKTLPLPPIVEEDSLAEKKEIEIVEFPEYGYIAQELKEIFPDLVKQSQDSGGYYAVNYIGLIPIIVEALKDQRSEIEKQREQIKQLVKLLDIKSINEKVFEENGIESIPILLQNTPNPFNQATEIGYFIPENVNSANIYIYDVNGFQQRNIAIFEHGKGATTLQASALQAGIYFYTLICDGKPVDAKQMILTR